MKMDTVQFDNIQNQLRSKSLEAVKSALAALARRRATDIQIKEIKEDIISLFVQGPPFDNSLISVILAYPYFCFGEQAKWILEHGDTSQQAQALQWMEHWISGRSKREEELIRTLLTGLLHSGNRWVEFLAAMQMVHIFGAEPEMWQLAAQSIIKGDAEGTTIRSRVKEFIDLGLLKDEDISSLNGSIEILGGAPIQKKIDQLESMKNFLKPRKGKR
jgi:hypothetical protein